MLVDPLLLIKYVISNEIGRGLSDLPVSIPLSSLQDSEGIILYRGRE
jgi:hypothetical protein